MKGAGLLALAGLLAACAVGSRAQTPTVRVEKTAQGFRLIRDGKPYTVKGAGGDYSLEMLKACGGNSVRTWGADDLEPLLDEAHRLGLTVAVGIWLGQPRQGFNYGDAEQVKRQMETARGFVRRYRNHPAVLLWGLGNEAEGDGRDPRIWQAINDLARMAKTEDPNHPTMTVVAEMTPEKAQNYHAHCPDVDILGINSYAGLPSLPRRLREAGLNRPYIVTEFGPHGTWEVRKTPWGAPVEATSTEKAAQYRDGYRSAVAGQPDTCLGSYAFLWGHKQEATSTWFGMFLRSGEKLGAVDAITLEWTGKPAEKRCPEIQGIDTEAAEKEVPPNAALIAEVKVSDPEKDPLVIRWEVRHESTDRRSGGDVEREPLAVPGVITEARGPSLKFRAPSRAGAYRLYVFVYDGRGGAAVANIPFSVK